MNEQLIIQGQVWCLGDNIDTDQILPGYAMAYPREQLKFYALAGSNIADFSKRIKPGDIIVAGSNFGSGSSREQAPTALKDVGVGAVIAKSFARIFRRNSINIGLPVMCADVIDRVKNEDKITVNIKTGKIVLADKTVVIGQQLSENVISILSMGGIIPKIREQIAKQKENDK